MKSAIFSLLVGLLPLHAAELQPSRIPASARWSFHADLDAMRASGSGKTLFALLEAEHGKKLRAFKRMFALHPLEDLRDITLFGDGKPDHAVALIHGRFDPAHLVDVVGAADDYRTSTHAGITLHHWQDKGVEQHAAFANPDLLVFSRQEPLLREALVAIAARTPVAGESFHARHGGRPLIAASARLAEIELPGDGARLVRLARTLQLAAQEHEGRFMIRMAVETADEKDADRLRRMIDGMVAFAQAGDAALEELEFDARPDPGSKQPGFTGTISLPLEDWIPLLQKASAPKEKP